MMRIAPPERLVCLDIETTPDRARLPAEWGDRFPRTIHHEIVCISYVEAEIEIDADGGERFIITACRSGGEPGWSERQLLECWWGFFAQRPTRVVTWNGRGFDISTLLHRSMIHGLAASGWYGSPSRYDGYTYRYSGAWHCDLMDQLADFGACQKLSLDAVAAALGLPGKIGGHGSEVAAMVAAGEVERIRAYCEGDVLNLACIYARHALLTGRSSHAGHAATLDSLTDYLSMQSAARPHLATFLARLSDPVRSRVLPSVLAEGSDQ